MIKVAYISIYSFLPLGQTIGFPSSSVEYALLDFKIAPSFSSSLVSTFYLTPLMAWLTKGTMTIVG